MIRRFSPRAFRDAFVFGCLAASCAASAAQPSSALPAPPPATRSAEFSPARPQEAYQLDVTYRLRFPEMCTASADTPDTAPDVPFAPQIEAAARQAGVDPALVHAVVAVESAYRPAAVSPKGAVGLMQLMPGTAQRYGVTDLKNVPENLKAGTRHLRSLVDAFGERLDLVLAAYNAGEGAVRKYRNTVPPYRETRDYVPAVLKRYKPRPPAVPQKPATAAKSAPHEYLPGTRLDPAALARLEGAH